jgi:glycosyltransferase involved in cell wall biosynthesis
MERHAAKQCHRIICVGESQYNDALARHVGPAEKLKLIRNGIQTPTSVSAEDRVLLRHELGLPVDAKIVGMVARLAPQKGVGMFVKAAALVRAAHPDVVFALVGEGPLESEVRTQMKEFSLSSEQFRLLGHHPKAECLYPAFDLVALSSLYEGLPYVLLEAMSYGIPVVATDVLGSRDVVLDGVTGFLSRPHDAAHLASRIQILLEDTAFRRRCGDAAQEHVQKHFSFETFVTDHRDLYERNSTK